jgi:predicted nucleotidyltransferase
MKPAYSEVEESLLREIVRRIVSVRQPQSIILFGSHARGEAHAGSDLDILIVERENPLPRHQRAAEFRMALGDMDLEIDLLVYTSKEIEEWSQVPNAFPTTAVREGKNLYERPVGPGQRVAG